MRDDAHDGLPRLIVSVADALPQGFLIGPILMGKIFVDDSHRLSASAVLIGKEASADQPNAHRFEIMRTDAANVAVRPWITWRRHAPFDVERCGTSKTAERQRHARGGADPTGGIGKPLQGAAQKCNLLLRRIVLALRQRQGRAHHSLWTKAYVDLFEFSQAFQKHSGPGK